MWHLTPGSRCRCRQKIHWGTDIIPIGDPSHDKNGHFFNSKLLNFRRVEQYKFPVPLFFSDDPCGGRVSLDDDLGRHHLVAGHIILLVEAEVQEPL